MVVGDLFDPVTGMIRLGFGLVLLVIVFALSRWKNLDVERDLAIAAIRGFVQLMLLSLFITWIFDLDNLFLVLIVLAFMVTAGGYTAAKRAKSIPKLFSITTTSILIGSAVAIVILVLIGLIPLEPEFLIPLGGMAIGNAMIGCSLTINRLKSEFKNNRDKIETTLVLGATSDQAGEPYFRESVRAALIPTIDNLKTLGIIFIPGAMTGMLIAGANVIWAAEYQIMVFLMIMSSKSIAIIILTILIKNRLFTQEHQLNEKIQFDE
jgi:putative ABC transport system permease protein